MQSSGEPPLCLGDRLRLVRAELVGPDGADLFARRLGLPPQIWRNYEVVGELAPVPVLRAFVDVTGVSPLWLLRGDGPRYCRGREPRSDRSLGDGTE
ncbi:MAG: hypothetical protein P4L84_33995 [Isosphaeraceae bacterium]|nr:hypothetical protein [Isosphaeraceae bacterium]